MKWLHLDQHTQAVFLTPEGELRRRAHRRAACSDYDIGSEEIAPCGIRIGANSFGTARAREETANYLKYVQYSSPAVREQARTKRTLSNFSEILNGFLAKDGNLTGIRCSSEPDLQALCEAATIRLLDF